MDMEDIEPQAASSAAQASGAKREARRMVVLLGCVFTLMNVPAPRFIPAERRNCRQPSTVPLLHRPLDLALAFALLDGVALVVRGLALGQRDLDLGAAVFP